MGLLTRQVAQTVEVQIEEKGRDIDDDNSAAIMKRMKILLGSDSTRDNLMTF